MNRPTGSNPWKYNDLPDHLKKYMTDGNYTYSTTVNGKTYYGADAFNLTDRRTQDHLITQMDARNLRDAIQRQTNGVAKNIYAPEFLEAQKIARQNPYAFGGNQSAPTAPAVPQASPAQTPSVPSASPVSVVMPNQSAANPMSASVPAAPKQQAKAYMPSRMEGAVSKAASMGKMKSNQIDAQRQYDMRRTGQSQLVNQMGFPTPSGATTNQSNTSSATAPYKPSKPTMQWVWDDPKEKAAWDSAGDKNTYTYLKDKDFMSNVPMKAIGLATPEAMHQFNKEAQSYYLSGEWKSKIPQKASAYKNTNKPVPMPRKNTNSTLASSLV